MTELINFKELVSSRYPESIVNHLSSISIHKVLSRSYPVTELEQSSYLLKMILRSSYNSSIDFINLYDQLFELKTSVETYKKFLHKFTPGTFINLYESGSARWCYVIDYQDDELFILESDRYPNYLKEFYGLELSSKSVTDKVTELSESSPDLIKKYRILQDGVENSNGQRVTVLNLNN